MNLVRVKYMTRVFRNIFPWLVILGILLIGILADICVRNGYVFIKVTDLRDVVKNMLGAQATVAVLSLSVLTLLGSFIDKTYYGIALSDFYSNRKNPFFTGFLVIAVSLVLLLLAIVLFFFHFYNIVIATFFATLTVIFLATKNVYYVFKGDNAIKEDIEGLFDSVFSASGVGEKKLELFEIFSLDWRDSAVLQTVTEFEKYKEKFIEMMLKLLNERNPKCTTAVCACTKPIVQGLLIDAEPTKKEQGILLLRDIYIYASKFIVDLPNSEDKKFAYSDFSLISEVIYDFLQALELTPREWLYSFDWYNTLLRPIDTIAFVADTKAKNNELTASLQISLQMGLL